MSAGNAGVDLLGCRRVGIHQHQAPTAFGGELETTATQTIDALGWHDDGHAAVAADRGALGRVGAIEK